MKLVDVKEMTINVGVDQTDDRLKPTFDYLDKHGTHVGDQDGYSIYSAKYNATILYGVRIKDGTLVTVLVGNSIGDTFHLQVIHTLQQHRNLNHAIRLLWFVKNQESKQIIDYGAQTADGIRFVQALARSGRFTVVWYNLQTKEKIKYSPEEDGIDNAPYRGMQQTPWRILIEGEQTPTFERYAKDQPGGVFGEPYHKLWN